MTSFGTTRFMTQARTFLLLAALTGLMVAVGGLIGGAGGLVLFAGIAIVFNFATFWFSDRLALKMAPSCTRWCAASPIAPACRCRAST
jgi:hypothetical protein